MSLLEVKAVTMDFPGVRALSGVSFDVREGEIHALCGENGAGKSTLIKIISGVHPAGSFGGALWLRGERLALANVRDAEAHGIALISQELALVPNLSVTENLMLGCEPVRRGFIDWTRARREAVRGLELVGLDVDPDRLVRDLGIGEQQLVEIARALLKDADVLILDEPTAALGESARRTLLARVRELSRRGVACIYISHHLDEVFEIADRITVLRDGRSVASQAASALTKDEVVTWMVGREVRRLEVRPPPPSSDVALEVRSLSVAHPEQPERDVLTEVCFSVRRGEILGVAGLMGAGRTALLATLFGLARGRVRGTVELPDRASTAPMTDPIEAIRSGLAFVSEDRKGQGLWLGASLVENLTLVTLESFLRRGLIDDAARVARAEVELSKLHVRAPGGAPMAVGQLSGGNQQKIVLGKWLMAGPKVLLLDEPTRGIDVGGKSEIYMLIERLASEGLAVILVSSELPELIALSHRVLVLSRGRVAACLDRGHATAEAIMTAATGDACSTAQATAAPNRREDLP